MEIYRGNIVYSKSSKELVSIVHGYIIVSNGVIQDVFKELPKEYKDYKLLNYYFILGIVMMLLNIIFFN